MTATSMHPTPNTQPRHALRWVLGVGLAFVVVVGMALQVSRRRASEEWERAMAHLQESGWEPVATKTGRFSSQTVWVEGDYVSSVRTCRLRFGSSNSEVQIFQRRGLLGFSSSAYVSLEDDTLWPDLEALLEELGVWFSKQE